MFCTGKRTVMGSLLLPSLMLPSGAAAAASAGAAAAAGEMRTINLRAGADLLRPRPPAQRKHAMVR